MSRCPHGIPWNEDVTCSACYPDDPPESPDHSDVLERIADALERIAAALESPTRAVTADKPPSQDDKIARQLGHLATFRRDSAGRLITTPTPSKDDSIEQATGSALDTWGWALDCPRKPGETDDAYRKALLLCCRWEHDSMEEWEAARAKVMDRKVKS